MESNLVNSFSESNNAIVKGYFKDNFPLFQIIFEISHGAYWGVKLSNNEIEIKVSGDIGFSVEVFIDNCKFELWQFDRSVNQAMKTNKENIIFQLEVLGHFLSETIGNR